jgi:hypothetical protein
MPSPQLVADAPIEGTLRPLVAGALLAVTLGGLFLMAWLGGQFKEASQVRTRSTVRCIGPEQLHLQLVALQRRIMSSDRK